MAKILRLFTQFFPYQGGETFLIEELPHLSAYFDLVIICPSDRNSHQLQLTLPRNVEVEWLDLETRKLRLRALIRKYFIQLLSLYIYELIHSKNRWKYIRDWNWNFFRLIGIIHKSESIPTSWKHEDSIWYTYWFHDWTSILSWKKRLGWKNRLVTRAHGFDFDEAQQFRGYHPFRHSEIRMVNRVVQISNYGRQYMLSQLGRSQPIVLSYLGSRDCGQGPLPDGPNFTLVTCSNLVSLKRLHLMPEILSHLEIPFHWIHFGGDKEGLAKLTNLTIEYLDATQFEFKGQKENAQILEFYTYHPVDAFINISELEGIPFSMIEAASFGIPLVGCDICGVPEIVNERTGMIIPKYFDTKEVAKHLEISLKTNFRDASFRKGVREFWNDSFRADNNYPKFITNNLKRKN